MDEKSWHFWELSYYTNDVIQKEVNLNCFDTIFFFRLPKIRYLCVHGVYVSEHVQFPWLENKYCVLFQSN